MIRELSEVEISLVSGGFITVGGVDYTEDEWNSLFNVPTGTSYGPTDIFGGMLGYNSAWNSFAASSAAYAQQWSSWSSQQSAIERAQHQVQQMASLQQTINLMSDSSQTPILSGSYSSAIDYTQYCAVDTTFTSFISSPNMAVAINTIINLSKGTGNEYGFVYDPVAEKFGPIFTSRLSNTIIAQDYINAYRQHVPPGSLGGQYLFHTHPGGGLLSINDKYLATVQNAAVVSVTLQGYLDCVRAF